MEAKFTDGMSWENKGKWHVDHIIPLSSFDMTDEEQLRKACHYSNLQPLWGPDNLAKSDRLPDGTRGRDAAHQNPSDCIASCVSLTNVVDPLAE